MGGKVSLALGDVKKVKNSPLLFDQPRDLSRDKMFIFESAIICRQERTNRIIYKGDSLDKSGRTQNLEIFPKNSPLRQSRTRDIQRHQM